VLQGSLARLQDDIGKVNTKLEQEEAILAPLLDQKQQALEIQKNLERQVSREKTSLEAAAAEKERLDRQIQQAKGFLQQSSANVQEMGRELNRLTTQRTEVEAASQCSALKQVSDAVGQLVVLEHLPIEGQIEDVQELLHGSMLDWKQKHEETRKKCIQGLTIVVDDGSLPRPTVPQMRRLLRGVLRHLHESSMDRLQKLMGNGPVTRPSVDVEQLRDMMQRSTVGPEQEQAIQQNLQQVHSKLDKLAQSVYDFSMKQSSCILCATRQACIAYMPCGHVLICNDCATFNVRLGKCPACQGTVSKMQKIFLP
jgi:hypothetical protein